VLEITGGPTFDPRGVSESTYTIWRYRQALPVPKGGAPVTLGEGWTPLVDVDWDGRSIKLKAETQNPTGSFKDRGAALLVTALRGAGVRSVVEDSSGNAGAALSAYAARGGLHAKVYVPAHASSVKQDQIAVYGAEVVTVTGSRAAATRAVLQAVEKGAVYASHAYSPLYAEGMKTVAFEIWEQCGSRAPGSVVVPVGHGGLLLGLSRGFDELLAARLVERRPRLFGVQAEACAPLAQAWAQGATEVEAVQEGNTVAGGVRIADPPWGRQVLEGVRRSGGGFLAVSDEEVMKAQDKLARTGFYVEPTSALVIAALDNMNDDDVLDLHPPVVLVLTGSGFKSPRR
jgi:threonine synthase